MQLSSKSNIEIKCLVFSEVGRRAKDQRNSLSDLMCKIYEIIWKNCKRCANFGHNDNGFYLEHISICYIDMHRNLKELQSIKQFKLNFKKQTKKPTTGTLKYSE